jgi:hypothetical protein
MKKGPVKVMSGKAPLVYPNGTVIKTGVFLGAGVFGCIAEEISDIALPNNIRNATRTKEFFVFIIQFLFY